MARWRSAEGVSPIEHYLLEMAFEEADLWTVPQGMHDALRDGRTVDWPAQDRSEYSRILLSWFDEGLIGIHRADLNAPGGNETLSQADARALLEDPTLWRRSIGCRLFLTKAGMNAQRRFD